MKNQKVVSNAVIQWFLVVLLTVLVVLGLAQADWLKVDPPPDVDKYHYGHKDTNSCWLAAAANMLAGAGYGDGSDANERADDIYEELCDHNDPNQSGWADTALNWWLSSNNNTWSNNPYKTVRFHGHRNPRPPWARPDLPKLIGNRLRDCEMLRISIRKPTCDADVGKGGHALTAWGDDGDANQLTENPDIIWVTDSDRGNTGVWEENYTYDDYNNPNPGDSDDCNEGVGWYIYYKVSSHWYIDGIVTLSTTDGNSPSQVQTVVVSTTIEYDPTGDTNDANDLHYRIVSDANILSYSTTISSPNDWETDQAPICTEDTNEIDVYWDLKWDPVPKGTTMVITASIVIPQDPNDANDNSVGLRQICWTPLHFYPILGSIMHGMHDGMPGGAAHYAPNASGGYVISSYKVYHEFMGAYTPIGECRFQHEHKYYQDPEHHVFTFVPEEGLPPPEPPGSTYAMGNFRFGHSWALLLEDELWQFGQWRDYYFDSPPYLAGPYTFPPLNWTGQLLPYPQGQVYNAPDECGDPGTDYLKGDVNKDCYVDFKDVAEVALDWLGCTDPQDPNCAW